MVGEGARRRSGDTADAARATTTRGSIYSRISSFLQALEEKTREQKNFVPCETLYAPILKSTDVEPGKHETNEDAASGKANEDAAHGKGTEDAGGVPICSAIAAGVSCRCTKSSNGKEAQPATKHRKK
jgi:hypothetical protein